MNEATFRKVNEGLEAGQPGEGVINVICECGRLGCNAVIALTRTAYEAVRDNPRTFVIVEGHEIDEAERVVQRHPGYVVVEKREGIPADVVEHTDPRKPLD